MSDIFIKTAAAGSPGWRKMSNLFVKTAALGSTGWRSAAGIWIRQAASWLKVWPFSGVFSTRNPWIGANSDTVFADRLTTSDRIRIGSNYYGNNAQWDANGWTISSYSYAWKYYSTNDGLSTGVNFPGESGTGSGWTAGGTGQDVLPLSTWDNSTNNTTYDRKYVRFEVTANASNPTYSSTATSSYIQIVRRIPSFTGSASLSTNSPAVGSQITYTSPTWDTSEARKEESLRTTIVWYRNSTSSTVGGTQIGTGSTYTPVSADIDKYIYVIETRFNSGTDYEFGSTIGVSASVITTNKVAEVNNQATGSQRRIALPSNFTSGTNVYITTNGYIAWGGSDPGGTRTLPTTGLSLAPLLADLRQGGPTTGGGLWTFADSTSFTIRWKGSYYVDTAQIVDYQIKLYWGQAYADVYFVTNGLTSVTPSTTAVQNGSTIFRTWSQSTSQTSTLMDTSTMYNITLRDGADDNSTPIYAVIPAAPTLSSVTFTAENIFDVAFTGGSGPYYQLFWNTSGTAPSNTATYYDSAGSGTPIRETFRPVDETTYYFWVRSSVQNIATTQSAGNAATGSFSNWSATSVNIKPFARPTSLSATTNDRAKITLTWSGGAGPNYQVYWTQNSSTKPVDKQSFSDFSAGATSPYEWTGMTRGATYYLFIRANNGTDYTNWFPTAAPGRTGKAPLYAPGAPTSFTATRDTTNPSSEIDLSWTAPGTSSTQDSASGYDIYYSTSSSAPNTFTSPTTNTTSTSIAITGLSASTTYYFWVRATNADNTGSSGSAWTGPASASTSAALSAPSGGSLNALTAIGTAGRIGTTYSVSIATEATGNPTPTKSYQWQYFRQSSSAWVNITGETLSSYTIPWTATSSQEGTISMPGRQIRCLVTWSNSQGSQAVGSAGVTIDLPTITGITVDFSNADPFVVYRCYGYNFRSIESILKYGVNNPPETTGTAIYSQAGNSTIPITRQSGQGGLLNYYQLVVTPYSTIGTGSFPSNPYSSGVTRTTSILRNTVANRDAGWINTYGTGAA